VKTTIKRGIGRSGSANGNGRAVLPPVVLADMTVYRQPQRRRGVLHVVGRVIVWLVVIAAVVLTGMVGGVYLYAENDIAEAIAPKRESVKIAEKKLNVTLPGSPAIALVVGYDRRHGEQGREFRSDTIMLVRADPNGETLSTLSFPRDLLVDVHCPGSSPYPGRINEAFALCQEQGTLETVRRLTGLPIHYLVTVNFRGFKQIVAKLGGVWMDVDRRYFNEHTGPTGYAAIDLKPGYQKLNGAHALDFVRFRHTDSDHHRLARQQLFLESFKESVTTSISPLKLLKVVKVITSNVEVAQGGGGGVELGTLRQYALLAYQLPNGHFAQSRIRPERVYDDAAFRVIAPADEIDRAVWNFTHPQVERVRKRARQRTEPKAPPVRETTVLVLNGNGVQGAAATSSDALRRRGYLTTDPPVGEDANAPRMNYANSMAYFQRGDEVARSAARRLARLVGNAEVKRLPRQLDYMSNGAMVVFVVGQSFDGLEPPGGPEKRTPQPPYVTTNPGASLELVREARKRVPFPVMLPHVLEKTSLPDSELPMRVYRLAGKHKAVRLVYETGAHEFWGIQMTNWNEAPIVSEPNKRKRIAGRTYELHYAGQDLRAVVVRHRGASYWVVNTLLNRLSNETMLAIAKGLKPLRKG
jgi:LCP family protein required for cell wall assembly